MYQNPQEEICISLALDHSALILHLFLLKHSGFTFPFSTGIILNYFMQDFSRRSCQRSPPNPAYTRAPTEAGGGQQLFERTKEPNPNS